MFLKLKGLFRKPHRWAAIPSLSLLAVFLLSQILILGPSKPVLAEGLLNRSVQVMNPLPSAFSEYFFNFDIGTSGTLGSILFQFCANGPVLENCQAPDGFSAQSVTLTSQSGPAGFSLAPGRPDNEILLSRSPAFSNSQAASYVFDEIQNAQNTGTSYVEITTFASQDASGNPIDQGGVAYAITNALGLSTEVPQYLEFCAAINISGFNCAATSGDSINFGEFTPKTTAAGTSEFLGATNAAFGYNVILNGTTLTSGNNVIAAASGSASTTGTNQFGLNLRANSVPQVGSDPEGPGTGSAPSASYSQPNRFRFSDGDILVSAPTSDNFHKFTVSYIVNISPGEPAGNYVSTMNFICLANF
jgi:hypothetical protein